VIAGQANLVISLLFPIFVYSTYLKAGSLISAIFLCCISTLLRGQDLHFSQFNGSLLNLSPAFTGMFNGDYRIGAIYRSQWQSVPVSYSTFSMHGERRMRPRQLEKDNVGIGILFNSDRAGDARYGTSQFYISGSYIHLAKADSSLVMSVGTSLGWCQVGFDYSKMTFDNQYDGFQFNRSLGSGEQFGRLQRNFFDMHAGAVVQYIHETKQQFTYGLGVYHITTPVISYQGNDISKLDYKMSNYFSYLKPLNYRNDLIAEAMYNVQGKNYELIPHLSLRHHINRAEAKSISGGLAFRSRDALIVRFGYLHKTLQSGISYDINISDFTPATNRRGGFEIFLNYVIRLKPGFIARSRPCPAFI
jgi:type IX secretion system PorP/SprF family membrane protein